MFLSYRKGVVKIRIIRTSEQTKLEKDYTDKFCPECGEIGIAYSDINIKKIGNFFKPEKIKKTYRRWCPNCGCIWEYDVIKDY